MQDKVFVEIGSCDFDTCLPLAENGWRGVMVEAVPEIARTMEDHLAGYPKVKMINKAVSDYDGMIEFHVSNGDDWAHGISSVAANNHKGTRMFDIGDGANRIFLDRTELVPCVTLDKLLEENGITSIDYLKLDTEGHETNILEAYSWKIKPTFIKLEHAHIDDKRMKILLEKQGYIVYTEDRDMYAVG